jgi:hypothetical protein
LLSSKIFIGLFILIFSLAYISCGEKDSQPDGDEGSTEDFNNPEFVLQKAKALLGDDIKFAYKGTFDSDTVIQIASGIEILDSEQWGIKFVHLKKSGKKFENVFESNLLDGSFKECLVQKIKFPSFDYELVYYSSLDYFIGSGGGEVFSYLVNFNQKEIFYSHLISEPGQAAALFLSENITMPEVRNFFISNFKREYPALQVVKADKELNQN